VSELLPNDSIEAVLQSCLEHFGPVVPDDRDLVNAQRFVETMSQGDRAIAEGFAGLNRDEARLLYSEVRPARSDRPIIPGSTDVGDVSWVVPTGQITAACWAFGTPAHSWQLVAQGKLPFAHKGMLLAAKAMSGAVLELIRDRNTLDAAIAEFQQRTEEKPYQSLIPDNVDTPSARLTAV